MRLAEHVACVGERSGAYRGLVGKSEGKIPHRRPRFTLEDNIKMDFQNVREGSMD
jgi:hypothetical protein